MIIDCPICDSENVSIDFHSVPIEPRVGGPGDRYYYDCNDCGQRFIVTTPEPPDDYLGDGVFADNH